MTSVSIYVLALAAIVTLCGATIIRNAAKRAQLLALQTSDTSHTAWRARPVDHGYLSAWIIGFVLVAISIAGLALLPSNPVWTAIGIIAVAGILVSVLRRRLHPDLPARKLSERLIKLTLLGLSGIAVLTTFGIVLSLLFESLRFFARVPLVDFLFGLDWAPQTGTTAPLGEARNASGFGALPVFLGTLLVTFIALSVAIPLGLGIAIYLSEYAPRRVRAVIKPAVEILSGIPTVVYGFFALLSVGPTIRAVAEALGFAPPTQSALAAGLVMGIMIVPLISSLGDDVLAAVPQELREGAYALGATRSEAIRQVVLREALPGLSGACLLGLSRAVGETMIVLMAAGRVADMSFNPLDSVTTVTVQIVTLLTGEFDFSSAKTLSAFALGLVLFLSTLALNLAALRTLGRVRSLRT